MGQFSCSVEQAKFDKNLSVGSISVEVPLINTCEAKKGRETEKRTVNEKFHEPWES